MKTYMQIKELFGDLRIVWRLKIYLICRLKKYLICILNNYLWIAKLSTDGTNIWRSKKYLQIDEVSADWRSICRWKNYLQMEQLSADQRIIWLTDWRMIHRSTTVFSWIINLFLTLKFDSNKTVICNEQTMLIEECPNYIVAHFWCLKSFT